MTSSSIRAFLLQLVLFAVVVAFGYYLYDNVATNLAQRNIASGFDFLRRTSGFDLIQHFIPYDQSNTYGRAFVVALLNTLLISFFGIVLSTIIGVAVGIARLSSNWLLSHIAYAYVEILRNIPLLLQLFFWYGVVLRSMPPPRGSLSPIYGVYINQRGIYLPEVIFENGINYVVYSVILAIIAVIFIARWSKHCREAGRANDNLFWLAILTFIGLPSLAAVLTAFPWHLEIAVLKGFNFSGGMVIIPELSALLFAISLYTASFIAEIVRGGIQAVNYGQSEAAQALGLNRGQILRLIILPQAIRIIIPSLTSQYLNLLKNTSLGSAIGYPELVAVATGLILSQTGQAIEAIAMTMAVYLFFSLTISGIMAIYGKYTNRYNY